MLKVAAYTQGLYVPSARYRIRQYIPVLKNRGIDINEIPSITGAYPPSNIFFRPKWFLKNISEHFENIKKSEFSDVIILQREFLSGFLTLETFFKKPLIFDVDDAIYLNSKFLNPSKNISLVSDIVICGNNYLADKFSKWNKNIEVLPTAVDFETFDRLSCFKSYSEKIEILWSGSSSGFEYLYDIEEALKRVLDNRSNVLLKIVSDKRPNFKKINNNRILFQLWNESIEFSSIAHSDIGIMPMSNTEWSKGKCSFKMLCYMASGLPVVCSPFGMNMEVLSKSNIGYGAISLDDWYDSLIDLIDNKSKRHLLGVNAKKVIKDNYSIDVISQKLYNLLLKFS
jgi:glycosyltransferase involved in cell wall biosynthesis